MIFADAAGDTLNKLATVDASSLIATATSSDPRRLIERIDFDSEYLPNVSIDDPFEPGPPNRYLSMVKPRIRLKLKGFPDPIELAPYGKPGPTKWPFVEAGLTVGGAFAAVGIALLVKTLLKK